MKTSYRIVETFHEGSPILVQRCLVCECQELADEVAALRAVGA